MDATELAIHRANTIAFIAENPTAVTLIPKVGKVRIPSGGWRDEDAIPRLPQSLRIIELGSRSNPPTFRAQDGSVREVHFWLLGTYDADMEPGDHWQGATGRQWEVADVIRFNHYEVRGLVVEYG